VAACLIHLCARSSAAFASELLKLVTSVGMPGANSRCCQSSFLTASAATIAAVGWPFGGVASLPPLPLVLPLGAFFLAFLPPFLLGVASIALSLSLSAPDWREESMMARASMKPVK
jgi:hypothetical protein